MDSTADATTLAAVISAAPAGVDLVAASWPFVARRVDSRGQQQYVKGTLLDYGAAAPAAQRYIVTLDAGGRQARGMGSSIALAIAAVRWTELDG